MVMRSGGGLLALARMLELMQLGLGLSLLMLVRVLVKMRRLLLLLLLVVSNRGRSRCVRIARRRWQVRVVSWIHGGGIDWRLN
jgi:hypothetical protein